MKFQSRIFKVFVNVAFNIQQLRYSSKLQRLACWLRSEQIALEALE